MRPLIRILIPDNIWGAVGVIAAAIPLLPLIAIGLGLQYGPTLSTIVDFVDFLLIALTNPLADFALYLMHFLGIDIELHYHWHYIWTLLMIYFARDVVTTASGHHYLSAALHALLAIVSALTASVASGLFPIGTGNYWDEFWIATFPVFGLTTYATVGIAIGTKFNRADYPSLSGRSFSNAYRRRALPAVGRTFTFLAVIAAGLNVPLIRESAAPSAVLIFIIACLLALYWFTFGPIRDVRARPPETSRLAAYLATRHVRTGTAMLRVLLFDGLLVLLDALL